MVKPSRLTTRDLATEALAGLMQRPGRSMLTMLGTVLGIGAFVAILGLTATAGGQIDKRFTVLAATEVIVQDAGGADPADNAMSFPSDAASRVTVLNGVVNAGVYWPVPLGDHVITAVPSFTRKTGGLTLVAADPSALSAMHPRLRAGRLYDGFHQQRRERVVVLGAAAAQRLGVEVLDTFPAVFINGEPYTVLGIVDDLLRKPEWLLAVIIPSSTALAAYGEPSEQRAEMLIETKVGAAGLIASQAALAIRPDAASRFKVLPPPEPKSLRRNVTTDLNVLFLLLAGVSLVIGTLGIANTTLVAVMERTNEIGLRRSVGARRIHIASQFLAESTALGLVGGLIGGAVGVAVVLGTAIAQSWTAVIASWTIPGAPLMGALVGLTAGLYPALRAARIEPADALRR